MTDTGKDETRIADEALNLAKSAVDLAAAQVEEVSRHFSDAVEKARRAGNISLLSDRGGAYRNADDCFHRRCAVWVETPPPLTLCRPSKFGA